MEEEIPSINIVVSDSPTCMQYLLMKDTYWFLFKGSNSKISNLGNIQREYIEE